MTKLQKIIPYLSFFISVFSIISSCFLFSNTSDYKLEKLSYDVCNYNKVSYSNLDSSILSIKFNEHSQNYKNYYTLQNQFYNNRLVNGARFISNNIYKVINEDDKVEFDVNFISQSTFSKNKKNDITYVLDYNQFAVYDNFSLSDSGGADFCFITEEIAQKLLIKKGYDITDNNKIELYKTLYFTKNNGGTTLNYTTIDGKKIALRVLGVLKSHYGTEYQSTKKVVGNENFILTWLPFKYPSYFDFSYIIDLKLNPYGNKETFKFCLDRYSNRNDYTLSIKQHNDIQYEVNSKLTEQYYAIAYNNQFSSKIDNIIAIALIISFLLCFILNLISLKIGSSKEFYVILIFYILLYVVLGIVSMFTFIYPIISLVFLIYFINYFALGGKCLYGKITKFLSKFNKKSIE